MITDDVPGLLKPRALEPGDLVVIASLSGPLHARYEPDLQEAEAALQRLGLRVRRAPLLQVGASHWWSAATPARIAAELNALLRDEEVRAIVAHDGGQTIFGYLDLLDVDAVRADPKPVLGYSDISLLHLVLHQRTGLVELEQLYRRLLTGTAAVGTLPASPAVECWRPGRAEGPLIGGVLNRIALVQATGYALPVERFDGALLFWEETGGHVSHVWSYLQVLRHAGILDRIGAMVVGVPHAVGGLEDPASTPTLREVVLDVLGDRDVPVLAGVEFGHAGPNLPLPVGIRAFVDADRCVLALLESACRPAT